MATTDPFSDGRVDQHAVRARLPWLVGRAGIGVVVFDRDFRYVYVNDAAAAINGIPVADHLGRALPEVLPDLPASFRAALREVVRTGVALEGYEVVGTTPASGDVRSWRIDAFSLQTPPAPCEHIAVVFTENSEQRRAERRLRQVIDGLFLFVGLCTPDGTLVEANETALKAGGLSPEDVLGKPFWEAYWWSHDADVQSELRGAISRAARGLPSRYDVVVRLAGEVRITIDFQLVPVVEDGEVVAIVPSGLDVTDRLLASRRLAWLASLSADLNRAVDTEAIAQMVIERGPAALGCDFVNVALLDEDARALQVRHPDTMDPTMSRVWSVLPLSGLRTPFHDAMETGSIVWVIDASERRLRYPDLVADTEAVGLVTTAAMPLIVSGQVLGAIGMGWNSRVEAAEPVTALVTLLADICGQAVWRVLRTDVSTALVRHLTAHLLDRQDRPQGLDVAYGYLPAMGGLNIGGDWYDVIALDEGRAAFIVGDVVGHGVQAAAQMALTKSTLRALVAADSTLATLVDRLSAAQGRVGTLVATACVAVVDRARGVVDVVSFGHHPTVLRDPSGAVEVLWGCPDAPIGLLTGEAEATRFPFPAGSTLVLYTDGLVEVRGEDPDDSLARLVGIVTDLPGEEAAEVCRDRIMASTLIAPRRDDVALIVVRHTG